MLFERRLREGLADGSVTIAFRRWRRPQVVAGHTYRTGDADLLVTAEQVDVVDVATLTLNDAHDAGFGSVGELLAHLRGDEALPLYRLRFRRSSDPDPREVLRAADALDDAGRAALDARLDRLDDSAARATGDAPWARAVLQLIGERPGAAAGDLATTFGWERDVFKRRVRSLKGLGLTVSLPVGYDLSPRGRSYLIGPTSAPQV
jgi:hypothetical protein